MKLGGAFSGSSLSRRELLAWSGAALLAQACQPRGGRAARLPIAPPTGRDPTSPIVDVTAPAQGFLGDDFTRPHAAFWGAQDFLKQRGGAPAPRERTGLVIVGGGMSGLATAYLHRDRNPIVLEQAVRFGGNSKGERWHGIEYSIGAAYLVKPEPDSKLEQSFYRPLGVDKLWRESHEDPVEMRGKLTFGFWDGVTDPAHKQQFQAAKAYLLSVLNGDYPDLPTEPDSKLSAAQLAALDRQSFRAHLEEKLGGPLHPHLETLLQHYCWSSFGGALEEISAASGLNFVAAEFEGICALPGGNAGVAEHLLAALRQALPPANLRPRSLVVDVRLTGDRVRVTVLGPDDKLYSIDAAAVVMACPKFVAKHVVKDLGSDQRAAIEKLSYRAYVVANLLIAAPGPAPALDLYLLGGGVTGEDVEDAAVAQRVTDLIVGQWAQHGHPTHSVLTLYRGYPYDGGRPQLYQPGALAQARADLEAQVPELLKLLGLPKDRLEETRIARWGHALPLAATGLIADGTWEAVRRPIGGRIFFVEQDNWPVPAIETALTGALHSFPAIKTAIG